MSEKQNFYINRELIEGQSNINEKLTKALKVSSDNRDSFIKFTKKMLDGNFVDEQLLGIDDLIQDSRLKYNLFITNGSLQLFIPKDKPVEIRAERLCLDEQRVILKVNLIEPLVFINLKNDFNTDEACVKIDFGEDSYD